MGERIERHAMSDDVSGDDAGMDGRDIADLLPFYANGTLPARERARVAAALGTVPALRRELELIEEERRETIDVNEALGAPSRQARDRFFAMLDARPPVKAAGRGVDLLGWVAARLSTLQPRTLAWSATLALVVLAVQGGVLGLVATHGPAPRAAFQTASVPVPAARGPVVVVTFAAGAKIDDVAKLLAGIGATIVAGPMPGGLFEIEINGKATNVTDLDAVITKLKADPSLVRFAAPGQAGGGD
jgi:anti-sigma factor RsiW